MRYWGVAVAVLASFVAALVTAGPTLGLTSQFLEDGITISAAKAESGSSPSTESLTLEDMKVGAALLCKATGMGTIGPGSAGTITSVTMNSCTAVSGCATVDLVEAANLPWKAEVTLSGSEFLGKLMEGGFGTPGYLFECTVAGILLDDICTKAESFWALTNESLGVDSLAPEEGANCSIGGSGNGLLHGLITMTLNNGLTLAVSEA